MAVGSLAFHRKRAGLFDIVRQIPDGRVVEVAALAAALNIPARHAACILANLGGDERDLVPWHRVIPTNGRLTKAMLARPATQRQIALLAREGHALVEPGQFWISEMALWQPPQTHRSRL